MRKPRWSLFPVGGAVKILQPNRIFQYARPELTETKQRAYALLVGQPEPDIPPRGSRRLSLVAQTQPNGARNPYYESMREVAPGDLVFSFMDTRILAVGIAQSYCWESPKPQEFGNAGQNWENIGWKVKVNFTELANKVRPKDHIEVLRPLLPERYSPLQPNGNGLQSVYLTGVPTPLAEVLLGLIGREVAPIALAGRGVKPEEGKGTDRSGD